jgi:phosphonate transport system ATP-binding protein
MTMDERRGQMVFELENVSHHFGRYPALSGVNLQIQAGEMVALAGPSGAGKSTLIRLLNGTLVPTSGVIRALGNDLAELSPPRLRKLQGQIGTIYQQFHLVENLRVVHNVNAGALSSWSFFKSLVSLIHPLQVEEAVQALAQVGIPEKLYERTDQLSGGEQQRVSIARVLLQDPDVILADEPISSLDPERSREIIDLLRDLSLYTGKTMVISLHAIEYALSHCERIVGLREGRIIFDAPSPDVTSGMIRKLYRIKE